MAFAKLRPAPDAGRIQSLDQFRGFAVLSMILVNILGGFESMPWTFKHHPEGLSFADTVAPSFLFAVGIGFRMTFLRGVQKLGLSSVRRNAARRYVILVFLGILVYSQGFRPQDVWGSVQDILVCDMWDALVDIGFAGLLALPFIHHGVRTRCLAAVGYLALYQVLYSAAGYGPWVMKHSIDGGPLGPLSWVFPLFVGTLAWDALERLGPEALVKAGLGLGILLVALGLGFSAIWPFSQRGMTASYAVVSSGISTLAYLAFHILADRCGLFLPIFRTFGKNPLFLYLLHFLLIYLAPPISESASAAVAIAWFLVVALACYGAGWFMEKRNLFVRL